MTTPSTDTMPGNPQPQAIISRRYNSIAAGVLLMATGAGLLLFQEQDFSQYFMLLLGLVMLLLGIFTRAAGWMIPGGIVSGIGAAIILQESPLTGAYAALDEDALVLLCMGAGFASITLFTRLFAGKVHSWALIPGGILGFIGVMMLLEGPGLQVLEALESYWPAVLVLIGAAIVYRQVRQK